MLNASHSPREQRPCLICLQQTSNASQLCTVCQSMTVEQRARLQQLLEDSLK
jgi:hypothetical protein